MNEPVDGANGSKHCLSVAQRERNANINFVAKSGELVSGNQTLILSHSSYLKSLVESSGSCGCVQDVPTLLLPDWDLKTIQAMILLLEVDSVYLTNNMIEELQSLMTELGFDLSLCKFLSEPLIDSPSIISDDIRNREYVQPLQKISIKKTKIEGRNEEQEGVRKKLSEIVDFLGRVQIKNEESLDATKKPLDELFSSLKYLPIEPSFGFLPTEIKTNILSYLCLTGAFISASVCREWKKILQTKLVNKEINIGLHCSNERACEDERCFMREELLKASATVKLDVCLKLCYPVPNVNPQLLAEGLTSVPKLRITKDCRYGEDTNGEENGQHFPHGVMLTQDQMEQFIETFQEKNGLMKSLELNGLNMTNVDQDKLVNCLLKVERLFLGYGPSYGQHLLNGDVLIDQLLHNASNSKIIELYLEDIKYSNLSAEDLANALCHVESVYLGRGVTFHDFLLQECTMIKRILYNVLHSPIQMKNLFIFREVAFSDLMDPESLKVVMTKLKKFAFFGDSEIENFDDYVEVARNIPGVNIVFVVNNRQPGDHLILIEKGIGIDTSSITTFDLSELFFNK